MDTSKSCYETALRWIQNGYTDTADIMEKIIQSLIRRILEEDLRNPPCMADLMAQFWFKNQDEALLVMDDEIFIMAKEDSDNSSIRAKWLNTTNLIFRIKSLMADGMFVKFESYSLPDNYIVSGRVLKLSKGSIDGIFHTEGCNILKNENGEWSYEMDGRHLVSNACPSEEIAVLLKDAMGLVLLPTPELKKYVKRNFKSQSEYSLVLSRDSLYASLAAMIIAVAIAVGSPFLNNKYAKSTLESKQYNGLIHTIQSNRLNSDSIAARIVKKDGSNLKTLNSDTNDVQKQK